MSIAYIVAGLAYGDEGKGATVDYLVRRHGSGLVVRYNGGSQAGHNVVLSDGRHHTFSQFGSGTFVPGVRTHLSRFMMVNPQNMMREEEHLRSLGIMDAFARTTVDGNALILTPFHVWWNRALANGAHNSCGQGIGVCRELHLAYGDKVLMAGDLDSSDRIERKLRWLSDITGGFVYTARQHRFEKTIEDCVQSYKRWFSQVSVVSRRYLIDLLKQNDCVIFEGAQGVLLDETYGDQGFNTWTDTTCYNAELLLAENRFVGRQYRLGVVRTYYTRHGDGPFPTEDSELKYPEAHNGFDRYQGKFRLGHFDFAGFRRALRVCGGVHGIALTHMDRSAFPAKYLEDMFQVPVVLWGWGPTAENRREWIK